MKGEFTKDATITMRVHPSVKRQAKLLPYSYSEIFEIGCNKLSKEIDLLMYQKGEAELVVANLEKELYSEKSRLAAINNRIRIVNPKKLDKETLDNMILESAKDYANDIYLAHEDESYQRVCDNDTARHSVLATAREWGYDGSKFLKLVEDELHKLCNTDL